MKIYVDTVTGTWGLPDGLAFVTVTPEQLDLLHSGELSDSEIIDFARNGELP